MKKKFIILNLLLVLVFVTACSRNVPRKEVENNIAKTKVKIVNINYTPFVTTIKLISETQPINDLDLSSQVGGIIEYAVPKVGSFVNKSQVLLKVDTKIAYERRLMAKYALDTAKSNFNRQKYLFYRSLSTSQNYENAFSQFKSAEAQFAIAELGYSNSIIKAPISGIITAKYFDIGEMCAPGVPIYNLIDLSKIKVVVGGLEGDLAKIKNKNIRVFIPAINQTFSGIINSIGVKADPRTKTFPIEIVFDNKNYAVKSGMIAEVNIPTNFYPAAIVIPLDCIIDKGPEQYAYIVKEDKAKMVLLSLGIREKNRVLVLNGLKFGDQLITEGQKILEDGEPVEIER
ncbi:MAG: efflux RND transporter periplasmic adaptor subunit [Candidatus Margulisiibacteriota bacterium]|jgi:membrane fusion protein (multidrug efflux system)